MNRTLDNATDQKTLETILQEHRGGNPWQLPNLKIEPSEWDKMLNKFWDWLNSLLPKFDIPNNGVGNYIAALMYILKILLVVVVAAGTIWVLYLLVRWGMRKGPEERTLPPREYRRHEELKELLAQAEAVGDWALAARISWKIFLKAIEESNARTPYEYEGRFPKAIPDLRLPYHLMFSLEDKSNSQLNSWQEVLKTIEVKRGAP